MFCVVPDLFRAMGTLPVSDHGLYNPERPLRPQPLYTTKNGACSAAFIELGLDRDS